MIGTFLLLSVCLIYQGTFAQKVTLEAFSMYDTITSVPLVLLPLGEDKTPFIFSIDTGSSITSLPSTCIFWSKIFSLYQSAKTATTEKTCLFLRLKKRMELLAGVFSIISNAKSFAPKKTSVELNR